jgi:hypothetical protein
MSFLAGIAERALSLTPVVQPVVGSRFTSRPPLSPEVSPEAITRYIDTEDAAVPEASAPARGPRPARDPALSAQRVSRPGFHRDPMQGRPGTVVGTAPEVAQPEAAAPARAWLHAPGPARHRRDSTMLTPSSEPRSADMTAGGPAESLVQPRDTQAGSIRTEPLLSSSRRVRGRASRDAGRTSASSPPETAEPGFTPLLPVDASQPPLRARVDATRAQRPAGSAPRSDGEGPSDVRPSPDTSPGTPRASALLSANSVRPPANGSLYETPAPSQTPVVRVTIGRIEVRAVMQGPPSAPRASPPLPTLSLDDYLQRHNGGGR